MSRTYRDRRYPIWRGALTKLVNEWEPGCWIYGGGFIFTKLYEVPLTEKEQRKKIAKYYADGYREFGEPGPAFWRNLTAERPHRRNSKKQLHTWIKDPDNYEVMILSKPKLKYWT